LGGNGGGWLNGGMGDDHVIGGDDDDYLDGGSGDDRLTGFEGMDSFFLSEGNDTVIDFDIWSDTIIIDAETSGDAFDIALFNTTIDGQDAMTIWHNTGTTILIGVSEESFSWDSISFV
jgi:Ca2+-binding RTX toxin-like protein